MGRAAAAAAAAAAAPPPPSPPTPRPHSAASKALTPVQCASSATLSRCGARSGSSTSSAALRAAQAASMWPVTGSLS